MAALGHWHGRQQWRSRRLQACGMAGAGGGSRTAAHDSRAASLSMRLAGKACK